MFNNYSSLTSPVSNSATTFATFGHRPNTLTPPSPLAIPKDVTFASCGQTLMAASPPFINSPASINSSANSPVTSPLSTTEPPPPWLVAARALVSQDCKDAMYIIFSLLDTNDDGILSIDDFFLSQPGTYHPAWEIIKLADDDNDGIVTDYEVLDYFIREAHSKWVGQVSAGSISLTKMLELYEVSLNDTIRDLLVEFSQGLRNTGVRC